MPTVTIRKGEPWGSSTVEGDLDATLALDDADLAALAADGQVVRVAAGDVHRTLGFSGVGRPDAKRFPMDLGWVELDDGPARPFVAHVVVRNALWLGHFAVVMNAAWLGDLYLGPRGHPNDGRVDITWGRLPTRQLLMARTRARAGTHLPHPGLKTARGPSWEHTFARKTPVRVDGVRFGSVRTIRVHLDPDAFVLVG